MWIIPGGHSFGEALLIPEGYILTALLASKALLHPLLMQNGVCTIQSTLASAPHYDYAPPLEYCLSIFPIPDMAHLYHHHHTKRIEILKITCLS